MKEEAPEMVQGVNEQGMRWIARHNVGQKVLRLVFFLAYLAVVLWIVGALA